MISAFELGLQVKGGSGFEKHVICPFHDDKKPSASFNEEKGLFYCQVCKIGMNVEQLSKRMGVEIDDLEVVDRPRSFSLELVKEKDPIVEGSILFGEGLDYLLDRGLTRETIRRYFRLGSSPDAPMIICKDQRLEKVSSISRVLPPNDLSVKYIVKGKKPPLWPFEDFAYEYETLIFVEGIFSRLRLNQVLESGGYKGYNEDDIGVFSLLGARIPKNLDLIISQTVFEQLVFLFDDDTAGHIAAELAIVAFPFATVQCIKNEIDEMSDKLLIKLLRRYSQTDDPETA